MKQKPMTATLFDPIQLGDYHLKTHHLKTRIFMAPMTCARTGPAGIPNQLVATYYAQRASADLIISEATAVHPRGDGWPGAPGIYSDKQQAGWTAVAYLLGLSFDADFGTGGHLETKPLEADIEQTLENLHWSEHLVSLTPMWAGELPAEFKSLIDRVLLSGTAFAPVKSCPAFLTATAQGVPIA